MVTFYIILDKDGEAHIGKRISCSVAIDDAFIFTFLSHVTVDSIPQMCHHVQAALAITTV